MSNLDLFVVAVAVGLLILAGAITLFARRSPLGDSPWYWVCMFSMAALAALFVMDGKYGRRQDHLENEYRYGTRTVEPGVGGRGSGVGANDGTGDSDRGTRDFANASLDSGDSSQTPGPRPLTPDRLISLWPLRIGAIGATLFSAGMLILKSLASRPRI
jgi:hypothetical protein